MPLSCEVLHYYIKFLIHYIHSIILSLGNQALFHYLYKIIAFSLKSVIFGVVPAELGAPFGEAFKRMLPLKIYSVVSRCLLFLLFVLASTTPIFVFCRIHLKSPIMSSHLVWHWVSFQQCLLYSLICLFFCKPSSMFSFLCFPCTMSLFWAREGA